MFSSLDKEIFKSGIELIETVISQKFTRKEKDTYFHFLSDLDETSFKKGIEVIIRDRVFTNKPTIAEIRNSCIGSRQNYIELQYMDACEKLRNVFKEYDDVNIVFDDPIIHLIIKKMGGLRQLGQMDYKDFENFLIFQFKRMYQLYGENINSYINEIPLYARYNINNTTTSYIGNKKKAKEWTENIKALKNNEKLALNTTNQKVLNEI